jgi:ABC-type uncharacterized transport system ATPase component
MESSPQNILGQVLEALEQAVELYYRLVLVVGLAGSGKTTILKMVRDNVDAPIFNVSLSLAEKLLELTQRQRVLKVQRLLDQIVKQSNREIVLMDNVELLFDASLQQDPLRLLQTIARNKTIVAAWNGSIIDNSLVYAVPGHSEYRRYPVQDFLVVRL